MNKVWKRIKCAVFGHAWVVGGENKSNVGAERNCVCGAHIAAVVWPRMDDDSHITWPGKAAGRPRPDVIWPDSKPPVTDCIESLMLVELKAIRAALEVQNQSVRNNIRIDSMGARVPIIPMPRSSNGR